MEIDREVYELQKQYAILSDFTRLKILKVLLYEESTLEEISSITQLSHFIVSHQIRYLIESKIILPTEIKENTKYRIKDEYIVRRLKQDLKHLGRK